MFQVKESVQVEFDRVLQHDWLVEHHDQNEHRRFQFLVTGCAVICLLSVLFPIWTNNLLPFTDYPVHLALIQASGFSFNTPEQLMQRFEIQWFSPYTTPYLLARFMSAVVPVETTGKLLLTVYLIATPLLFMRLMKLLGKPAFLAFPVFLILYNFNLLWGFVPFLVAVPVVLEILNQSVLYAQKPSLYKGLLLSMLFVVLFYTHVFALMVALCLYSVPVIASWLVRKKTDVLMPLPAIPALMLALAWRLTLTLTESDVVFLEKGMRFAPLSLKFRFFPDYVISGDPGWLGKAVFACMTTIVLLRFLPSGRTMSSIDSRSATPTERPPLFPSATGMCVGFAAVIWLLYVITPYSWLTAVWLFNRIAFLAVAFALLLLPVSSRFPASLYVLFFTLLCVLLMTDVNQRYRAFVKEALPGIEIMKTIPPESVLRYVALNAVSAFTDHTPYTHFGQYQQIRFQGLIHNPFAVLTHIPVRYRKPYRQAETGFRSEPFSEGGYLNVDLAYDRHDAFLFRLSHRYSSDDVTALFGKNRQELPVFAENRNEWVLFYRMKQAQ